MHKALVAVAHRMRVSIDSVRSRGQAYHELGATSFDQIDGAQKERYQVKRVTARGYTVTLTPQVASSACAGEIFEGTPLPSRGRRKCV